LKSTGIVRKVDELGRIVLPVELRRTLDIAVHDELEIYLDEDKVVLRKFENSCLFCAANKRLVCYMGKNVCLDCVQAMNEQI